jgi:hypothetical protein
VWAIIYEHKKNASDFFKKNIKFFCAKKLIENIGFGEYHMRSI